MIYNRHSNSLNDCSAAGYPWNTQIGSLQSRKGIFFPASWVAHKYLQGPWRSFQHSHCAFHIPAAITMLMLIGCSICDPLSSSITSRLLNYCHWLSITKCWQAGKAEIIKILYWKGAESRNLNRLVERESGAWGHKAQGSKSNCKSPFPMTGQPICQNICCSSLPLCNYNSKLINKLATMNVSRKNHKACGKKKSCSTQLFFLCCRKTHLGKILLKEVRQPVLMTNILGKQKLHMFHIYSTKNKEEIKSFLNLSVTFPYAGRQTVPELSLDINGSKQQNSGPWCFNYSLFRSYASKKLQKYHFPIRIFFFFGRVLPCFYLKLFDLHLQKISIHHSFFIQSPLTESWEHPTTRQQGTAAAHRALSISRHRHPVTPPSIQFRVWQPSHQKKLFLTDK